MKLLLRIRLVVTTVLLSLSPMMAPAQVLYKYAGKGIGQSFNKLASAETNTNPPYVWTNNVTLKGWYAFHNGGIPVDSYRGDDGSDLTGALYSYGL